MGFFNELSVKPWQEQGIIEGTGTKFVGIEYSSRIALYFLMMSVTTLFILFGFAYYLRMGLSDWQPTPEPNLLWFNTLSLIFSSVALQWTSKAGQDGSRTALLSGLLVSGAFAGLFLVGQWVAWQQLVAQGYYLESNPANSFFFLITGLHGLHMLGGLLAWGKVVVKMGRGVDVEVLRNSIQLCAVYWHFLLLLWVALFYLLLST
ncbi:MAG: cytochrome-c oxidase [Gammaproteobacteria bacterium]|nr:MAG: cytochrome-c oxidase [Gammaproteobacteria bacterium]